METGGTWKHGRISRDITMNLNHRDSFRAVFFSFPNPLKALYMNE